MTGDEPVLVESQDDLDAILKTVVDYIESYNLDKDTAEKPQLSRNSHTDQLAELLISVYKRTFGKIENRLLIQNLHTNLRPIKQGLENGLNQYKTLKRQVG